MIFFLIEYPTVRSREIYSISRRSSLVRDDNIAVIRLHYLLSSGLSWECQGTESLWLDSQLNGTDVPSRDGALGIIGVSGKVSLHIMVSSYKDIFSISAKKTVRITSS